MAGWSKALPLTSSCLSLLPKFESSGSASDEKVASDLGLGSGFC